MLKWTADGIGKKEEKNVRQDSVEFGTSRMIRF
jgi:hypothetical protein